MVYIGTLSRDQSFETAADVRGRVTSQDARVQSVWQQLHPVLKVIFIVTVLGGVFLLVDYSKTQKMNSQKYSRSVENMKKIISDPDYLKLPRIDKIQKEFDSSLKRSVGRDNRQFIRDRERGLTFELSGGEKGSGDINRSRRIIQEALGVNNDEWEHTVQLLSSQFISTQLGITSLATLDRMVAAEAPIFGEGIMPERDLKTSTYVELEKHRGVVSSIRAYAVGVRKLIDEKGALKEKLAYVTPTLVVRKEAGAFKLSLESPN